MTDDETTEQSQDEPGVDLQATTTASKDYLGRQLITPAINSKDYLGRSTFSAVDYMGRVLVM